MSNPKETHELIRQNEQIVKKSQKHDANLQKNSTLYFQIGLIVCLLFTYGLFEMTFETNIPNYVEGKRLVEPDDIDIPIIKPVKPTLEEPVKQKKVKQTSKFEEVPDDEELNKLIEKIVEPTVSKSDVNPDFSGLIDEPIEEPIVPYAFIQKVPIYPGCEDAKNNEERKKCFSKKITKLIQRKFEGSDIASNYGLVGKQKIDVQFTIDKTGEVTDIKTRSPHPKLDEEAERVINIIPKMTPGKQNNKNVGVIYTLPIVFHAQ